MDSSKVDMWLMTNGKMFESAQLMMVRDRLMAIDDSKWTHLQIIQFKDPTIAIVLSIVLGALGADRFYLGHTGLGIAKLLTCGGLGIWTIVDYFLIMKAAKEKNLEIVTPYII